MLTHTFARHVTDKAVEMNRRDDCFCDVFGILRDQTGDHARKDVSRASGRHARISGRIYPNRTVWLGNQRTMALQHHDQFVFAGEGAGDVDGSRCTAATVEAVRRAISPG